MSFPKFKDKVTGAMVTVASDSATMTEAASANADLNNHMTETFAKVAGTMLQKGS